MKKTLTAICLSLSMAAPAFALPLQNGDFETGDFTGWSGDLVSTGVVDPDTDSHFSIVLNAGPSNSNVAQVQNDDIDWIATLFQDFTLDSLPGAGWTMDITFWIQWNPTDSTQDTLSAELSDTGLTDTVDLLSGVSDTDLLNGTWVTQDITGFAQTWGGQDVELAFTLNDFDFSTPDTLLIDEISFRQHGPTPSVPEPATLLLLGGGMLGFGMKRFRRNLQGQS
ncbi:hypothetical protein MIN45_PP09 (plasmid) [Methylomarinovum tepidoasis]|uniref:Ice-binding protein C-terminal domain-containing protein n=1 Tax=Methylomarinovum tepidoasis TaxID=2840183 RepID=A0AAU9CZ54_9GAMM|nr:PEP-CTERM sorting domain-containing protein [Methylomarinovum sp. IN45]BCX89995.1 hypothetical protein MIN45_PP09 [Methylomarinovum sp. IN45]